MNYKHIIWDWNGTLLNDVAISVKIVNVLLQAQNGKTLTTDLYRQIFGFPVKDYYQRAGFDFDIESFESVGGRFMNSYNKQCKLAELHTEAIGIVKLFNTKGLGQSVLSARKQDYLVKDIAHFGLAKLLPDAWGIDNHCANGKVDAGLQYLKTSKLDPSNVILIGDTLHDADVAKEMGVDVVLVAIGHQNTERLNKSGVPVFNTLNEAANFIML